MSDTGLETPTVAQWIHDTLTPDTAWAAASPGGLWDGPAAHDTEYPFTRFGLQSGIDVRGISTVTIMQDDLWLIRGICPGQDYTPLHAIAARIHVLLHGVLQQAVPGGMIVSCMREQAFRLESTQGGREFRHLGGIYRINVQT